LAVRVLDPVLDYFGMIRLDYGFCSPELAREIPGRIDPKRDQHAACEPNRRGRPVCDRLGAAVDFIVEDESMLEVAPWIVANTPFDRLYFYGDDLPLHVSCGPEQSRQVVRMVAGKSGRLVSFSSASPHKVLFSFDPPLPGPLPQGRGSCNGADLRVMACCRRPRAAARCSRWTPVG
jgi:hypothetical protein